MKKYEFVGKLIDYKRLNNSYYGNPAYFGEFINDDGESLFGRTSPNASCAYVFLNNIKNTRKITYHFTKNGNIRIDYISILGA